jgi:flagellar biosynthesis/type III secretory pathway protein FliH
MVRYFIAAVISAFLLAPTPADAQLRLRQNNGLHLGQLKKGTEPAFARGYADGYRQGANDGKRHERYDPVGSRDYRNADQGYAGSYGSRDAYKNNYRAGFRQGYDDGYRDNR